MVKRLSTEDETRFEDWAHILFDQALLSEGGQLADPAGFVRRLNSMFSVFSEPTAEKAVRKKTTKKRTATKKKTTKTAKKKVSESKSAD